MVFHRTDHRVFNLAGRLMLANGGLGRFLVCSNRGTVPLPMEVSQPVGPRSAGSAPQCWSQSPGKPAALPGSPFPAGSPLPASLPHLCRPFCPASLGNALSLTARTVSAWKEAVASCVRPSSVASWSLSHARRRAHTLSLRWTPATPAAT